MARYPSRYTFAGCCPRAESESRRRLRARTTTNPIRRIGTSVGDGWSESSRGQGKQSRLFQRGKKVDRKWIAGEKSLCFRNLSLETDSASVEVGRGATR